MTRNNSHRLAISGLTEDRDQEKKQALLSLATVILFGGITGAALMSIHHELHYLFPFILGLGITIMGACYGLESVLRIRSLKRQIEIIHEDTRI